MDTASINELIETAVEIEAKDGYLAHYLEDLADARGVEFSEAQRREALELFEGYIRSVPELLSAAEASCAGTPVEATMAQVMRAAVTYWDEPDDLVPDVLGVLGLLDDAYFSIKMLQSVSERLEAESGHTLVTDDLSALDAVVRDILGPELAEVLDELVVLSLNNAPIDELIAAIAEHAGEFKPPSAQTSFTGMSVDALVEAHLGFTGDAAGMLRAELISALDELGTELAELGPEATIASARDSVTTEASASIEQLLHASLDEPAIAGASEIDVAISLLVGAVVERVVILGRPLERGFVVRCVDLVMAGAGWVPD